MVLTEEYEEAIIRAADADLIDMETSLCVNKLGTYTPPSSPMGIILYLPCLLG